MIDYELKKYAESQYRIKDIQMQIKEIERQIEDYNAISNMIERKQCENLGIQKQRMINKVIENEVIIRDKFIRKLRKKIVKLKDKENKIEESVYKITNIIENLEESDKFLYVMLKSDEDSITINEVGKLVKINELEETLKKLGEVLEKSFPAEEEDEKTTVKKTKK